MKKKVVTAFMMAALGSSLVFSQAADGSRYYSKNRDFRRCG